MRAVVARQPTEEWQTMDSTVITASAAALGSVVGAAASIFTTWITQRTQAAHTEIQAKTRERESLYGEFITESSRLTVEAMGHSLEQPETLVKLYGILGRIRLVATDPCWVRPKRVAGKSSISMQSPT
jgi:hypothetical protein